jgi:hypothetical protein
MNKIDNAPIILYIMGAGRCGSTILSIILGAHPEVENVGEIKAWSRHKGLPRDRELKDENYSFWEKVLDEYVSVEGAVLDFSKLEHICNEMETNTKLLRHLRGKVNVGLENAYYKHNRNLVSSIQKVSGKKIVLDSSKSVCRAYKLLTYQKLNVKVIQLIRDPRGAAWSFMKKDVEQKPKNILRAVFDYIFLNGACILIRYLFKEKVIKVKYEDLIDDPVDVIEKIIDFAKLENFNLASLIEENSEFKVEHLIDGNRIRKHKFIKFSPDEEWKKMLPQFYKLVCVIFARPLYFL